MNTELKCPKHETGGGPCYCNEVASPVERLVMPRYRHLAGCVQMLGAANGMTPKSAGDWPTDADVDYRKLDDQASRLTLPECDTFIDGEEMEAVAIAIKHNIHELHSFLNDAFDGHLRKHFYVDD